MSYRQKVMAALENADLTGGVAEELVPAAAVEVEAGAAEISSDMAEVDELNATTADAEGEVEALTDVQDLMQESVDSGEGMNEQTAEMAEIAVERIRDKLGFARGTSNIPGIESFGNKGSRLASTKLALESVTDTLKNAGKGILAFLKQIWEKLKSFAAGLIKSRAALASNLASAQKRATELKGSKKKSETLKSGAAKALSVDGKADESTAATVLADSAKLVEVSMTISNLLNNVGAKFDVSKTGQLDELVGGIEKALSPLPEVKAEKGEEGRGYRGHLVSGKAISFSKSAGDKKDKVGMGVEQVGKQAEEAKALSAEEVSQLLSEADAALKHLQKFDSVDKQLQNVTKSAIAHMEKLVKLDDAAHGGKKEEGGSTVQKLVSEMREVANIASKVGLTFPGLLFGAVKAAIDYGTASLGNLTSEEPAAKDGDKPAKGKK